jgi:hypothetical protein
MTARVETATEDGSMHITLSGEIDLANAAAVEEEIHAAVSHQASAVSVDLTDLTYLPGQRRNKDPVRAHISGGSCWNSSCRSTRPPADSSSSRALSRSPRSDPHTTDQLPGRRQERTLWGTDASVDDRFGPSGSPVVVERRNSGLWRTLRESGAAPGTVNLLKLSGGTGMVGSDGSVCVAWVRPLWPCR